MKEELRKLGLALWLLFGVYSIISYLIFLRDDFILERISFLINSPQLLETGRKLARLFYVNSLPTLLFFVTVLLMYFIYFRALRLLIRKQSSLSVKMILLYGLLFLITTFMSFPSLSTDIFDYIASNRVLFVHQANPWIHPPQDFPKDEFIYLGSWKFRASVYGPVQFLFSALVHLLGGDSIILNIIFFKLINSIFFIFTILLIKKILDERMPEKIEFGLMLFAWNPLVHIEIIGNAHNDIIMAFFIVLSFFAALQNKRYLTGFALGLATLSKLIAVIYAPIMLLWLLVKRQTREALLFLTIYIITLLIGFLSLGEGSRGLIENLGVQMGLYLRSLPTIIRFTFLKIGLLESQANIVEKLLTIPLFAILYIITLSKLKKIGLAMSLIFSMMIYLIIAAPMLQPWYLVWFLPLLSVLPSGRLQNAALLFSLSSLLYYVVLFLSFYFSPLHFAWQIAMYITIILPPVAVWLSPKNWYTRMAGKIVD
jgi:hypothetical protein